VHGDGGGDEYDIPTDAADNQVPTSDEKQDDHVEQASHVESQLRRSTREHQPSRRYSPSEYVLLTDGGEPESYQEALEHEHKREWLKAMKEELKSLHENHTYNLVKLPKGKRALKKQVGIQAED